MRVCLCVCTRDSACNFKRAEEIKALGSFSHATPSAKCACVCVCAFYIWHTSVLQGFRRQTVFGLGSDPQRGLEPVKKKNKLKTASLSISVALCPYHGGIEFIQYF